jgi:hypothetical protein
LDPETNRDRELDFLVAHPDLGLVIVEVKGRGVEPRDGHWVRRNLQGREEVMEEPPGTQLLAQQYALLRFLKEAGLGFVPQITRALALPALSLEKGRSLGPDLPACRILTREKLRSPFLALREAVTGGQGWEDWRSRPSSRNFQVRPEQMARLLEILAPHRPETLGLKDGERLGPWALNAVTDWWEEEKAGHVRMGTVHAFKGLEADVVVYLAPAYRHPLAQRLAYTAYSRARHRLVVWWTPLQLRCLSRAPLPELRPQPLFQRAPQGTPGAPPRGRADGRARTSRRAAASGTRAASGCRGGECRRRRARPRTSRPA